MTTGIYWFRRDLRLADNAGLARALAAHDALCFVYIDEPTAEPYDAHRAWLRRSLLALAQDLQARGGELHILQGSAETLLPCLAASSNATAVHVCTLHEPEADARDLRIAAQLSKVGVRLLRNTGRLLTDADQVRSQTDSPYRVFTPFFKSARQTWRVLDVPAPVRVASVPLPASEAWPSEAGIASPTPAWDVGFWHDSAPGEAHAQNRLSTFLKSIDTYAEARDFPAQDATSRLSAHLHFGEISPSRVLAAARLHGGEGADKFIAELGWREFAYYVLQHWPQTLTENFNTRFDRMAWREDPRAVQAWQAGRTGIPIVDAGMRQLWQQGRMHNRVRMIVASWLTKHAGVHWREGAKWFMHTLVDADLANNTLGWQWVAGTGVDAAPYFRIFNPVSQSQKFDASGDYVRRWLPELSSLDNRTIHAPWLQGVAVKAYPKQPIVDLQSGRQAALDRFAACRNR
ncbi:deoxyribodipyrimidine photo-lyase [Lysobacter sp. HDW10]|uniref:cryptochrome/photolyase family protein n=1 Tax=Lysobacter sp. HDW10 TaxID=2714936 RepID=UPI001409EE89|nr:deoxyribodipyrimidine photo-lyase [Lysobacter sp. HDW10]QIK80732.1 deoxyribodipyrimidine photo-lyase [Lysobacter sp. HDW10]